MKNSYDQLNIEYIETKNVSSSIWHTTIILILILIFIPLAELIDILDYNYAAPHKVHTCLIGWPSHYEPLQFKSLPKPN
ncbi:hypothetical protein [Tenacibaculum ovolyticum]|uniref:hypothetical protein n=1 Tax=Tenacibaculum ovolyticum TaxID=104270 RepID=UPI0007ECE772|nr:hypothetical protein [Tenacibaculum ovolyticum]